LAGSVAQFTAETQFTADLGRHQRFRKPLLCRSADQHSARSEHL